MPDHPSSLMWFELQVCPREFRIGFVPGQPILLDAGRQPILLHPEGDAAAYAAVVAALDEAVVRNRIPEVPMRLPDRCFVDESALASATLHLRLAYGRTASWGSLYPLDEIPVGVAALLRECRDLVDRLSGAVEGEQTSPAQPDGPVARVKVTRGGGLFLDGRPADLYGLVAEFARLKAVNGGVWYFREDPGGEAPPVAAAVIRAVIQAKLPIKLFETDFESPGWPSTSPPESSQV